MKYSAFILTLLISLPAFSQDSILHFTVKKVSEYVCTATFGGLPDKTIISKKKGNGIPNKLQLDCDSNYKVISFDCLITIDRMGTHEHSNSENMTDMMMLLIRGASSVTFYNIRYLVPGGSIRTVVHPLIVYFE